MSLSPARQHRLRVQAEQAAREGGSVRHASGYDLMLLQLAEDRRRLKGVQSTVKKAEIKVELLPKYAAWAEGVLASGGAQQDDVLMYVMLWRIDAGDYAGALEIGRHALRHGWVMPLGNRNVQTVLAEEMADAAQSAMLAVTGFDADLLLQTLELTDGLDMPDQSRARLHKAIGAVLSETNPALRAVAVMFMNPLAVLRGGLAAAGTVLRVLASGPLAMLRVALYAISGLLGALLSPIGLVVTALAGVALVVWKYWQPITAFLGGVVEGFKAAAGPISAAFEPLKPVFQWIGDKVQALWGWFTDLLTPVKSTSAELQSAAAMGRRFGEALAEGLNMVMHPLDSLKSGVSWLLEKLGIVSKEAAKAKLPESVTRQQPATVNADGKVMMPSGGFPSWGYGFAGMYDSGGYIPRGQFGIVGENGPEIVNGPANVTSRRNTAALAAVVAGMMGVAAAPAELPPLHPLALPAKGGEAIVSRAATVPLVQRIEAPTQIIIQTQPGQSAQDIAREVARQLDERERRLKAKARSNYSDQGGYDA